MSYIQQAIDVVTGDRQESYGNPKTDFEGIALIWSGILNQKLQQPIRAEEVALMMIGLKLRREAHKHKDDNIIDMHGYGICLEWMTTGKKPTQ